MDPNLLSSVLRTDFAAFAQKCFGVINPHTVFEDNWHIHAMAKVLADADAGIARRQIITMPPRSLKSLMMSVAWPAWLLGQKPSTQIMAVSYNETLAEQLSMDTRRIMESPFYRRQFPGTILTRSTTSLLETNQGGKRFATSITGSITGFGADWIIIDDPHNALEALSAPALERVRNFFDQSLSTRLNNEATGRILLVMQRLNENDLAGHLLEQGGWRQLKLQARATEDAAIDIGGAFPHIVRVGDLLHPQRLPQDVLDRKQRQMGSATFQAQYQQEPVPNTGNIIQRAWLRYDDQPVDRTGAQIVLSLDTATKTDPANDYSVCTVWVERDNVHHLVDLWRDKVDFPTLKRKIIELRAVHNADILLIEDQGAGSSLIQDLVAEGIPALPRKARDSKISRLVGASSYIESGLVWLPRTAPWLAEFESELLGFPAARHDDQVDSVSQYLGWVRDRPRAMEFSWSFEGNEGPTMGSIAEALANRVWR